MGGGSSRLRVPRQQTPMLSAAGGGPTMRDAKDRSIASGAHRAPQEALADARPSEDQLRTILDTIPALVWCFRPDGTVNYFNKRWHEYTGISREEAYGVGGVGSTAEVFRAILHPDDGPLVLAKWQRGSGAS